MRFWLIIGLLLFAATGAALAMAPEAPWLLAAVHGYPIALLAGAVLLAWRFERSRLVGAALLVGAAWATVALLPAAEWPRVIAPTTVLVPLAIAALAFDGDHALRSPRGALQLAVLLGATSVAIALVAAPIPSFDGAFGVLRALPVEGDPLALSRLALIAFVLAAIAVGVLLSRRRRPVEAGLLLLLPALLMLFAAPANGPARGAWAFAAAAILTLAAIESAVALAYHDELTGLPSRRALASGLRGLRPPYAIAAVDIDHFKNVNDTYGHDTGDQVLRMVASRLARARDGRAYRSGGEEFTLVFPGLDTVVAYQRVEAARAAIEGAGFRLRAADRPKQQSVGAKRRRAPQEVDARHDRLLQVTISAGVADAHDGGHPKLVAAAADQALYAAKHSGRNRVIAAGKRRVGAAG